jgi:VWFA-related protein
LFDRVIIVEQHQIQAAPLSRACKGGWPAHRIPLDFTRPRSRLAAVAISDAAVLLENSILGAKVMWTHQMMNPVKSGVLIVGCFSALCLPGLPGQAIVSDLPAKRAANDTAGQVSIPNRPKAALFQGEQGKQRTEIQFDPSKGIVTVRMLVQDPNGYFIPNIRRENFAVYENGARQQNATVEVEHAPVSIGVLMEYGGRYQALNRALGEEVSRAARQFLDEIGREDQIAIWKYGDNFEEISGFSDGHETLDRALLTLQTPPFSEVNFYDALTSALARMHTLNGRRALLLISSGLDTFSRANYEAAVQAVRQSGVPIYVINLGPALKQHPLSSTGPYVPIDWKRAESELQGIAQTSGGRMYSPAATFDLSGIYDDLMENLRLRYVISYKSTSNQDLGTPRTVRIELVDSRTGGPLEIADADGKAVRTKIFTEDTYVPVPVSTASPSTEAPKTAKQ